MSINLKKVNLEFSYLRRKLKKTNIVAQLDDNLVLTLKEKRVDSSKIDLLFSVLGVIVLALILLGILNFSFSLIPLLSLAWIVYSRLVYPKIYTNSCLQIDIKNNTLSHSQGLSPKLEQIDDLAKRSFSFQLFQGSIKAGGTRNYSITLYVHPRNSKRKSLLTYNGPFESDCIAFQKALSQFFENILEVSDISIVKINY